MAFMTDVVAVDEDEVVVFTPTTAETALMVRNTGDETALVGPAAGSVFPVKADEVMLFGGLATADVLSARCAVGETTELTLIWVA